MSYAKKRLVVALFSFSLLLLGCADGMAGDVGSCDIRKTMGFCYEHLGSAWNSENARLGCEVAPGGEFIPSDCPKDSLVGVCDFSPEGNKARRVVYYYYKDAFTAESAEMACPGTFAAK